MSHSPRKRNVTRSISSRVERPVVWTLFLKPPAPKATHSKDRNGPQSLTDEFTLSKSCRCEGTNQSRSDIVPFKATSKFLLQQHVPNILTTRLLEHCSTWNINLLIGMFCWGIVEIQIGRPYEKAHVHFPALSGMWMNHFWGSNGKSWWFGRLFSYLAGRGENCFFILPSERERKVGRDYRESIKGGERCPVGLNSRATFWRENISLWQ